MKEQIHIVLITVALFAAGLVTGVWTQRSRPLPPPPAPLLGEFRSVVPPGVNVRGFAPFEGRFGFGLERGSAGHAAAIAGMDRRIADLEPRIRQFQGSVDAIENDFLTRFDKILTPAQRERLASLKAAEAPRVLSGSPTHFPPPPPMPPGDDGRYVVAFRAPFPMGGWLLMSMVIYQPALQRLSEELKLDPAQQAATRALMVQRRSDLLALIDKDPPPTLGFGETMP